MSDNVAIYGITGALGREVLAALEVDHEGIGALVPVAGPRSGGQSVRWRGASLPVLGAGDVDPASVDVAIFATPPDVVAREAPRILHAGGRVIDASGVLARAASPAPLVWPQLRTTAALDLGATTAVSLPGALASSLAPLLEVLAAAHDVGSLPALASVDVVALVAASSAGRAGIDALSRQTVGLLNYQSIVDAEPFPGVLAFDVLADPAAQSVVAEERLRAELATLLPRLGAQPSLVALWVPALSGQALTLTLGFGAAEGLAALVPILKAGLQAHPDLTLATEDDAHDDAPREAAADGDAADDDEAIEPALDTRAALTMRAALDRDEVLVGPPTATPDGRAIRLVAFADPLRRTAVAAQRLVARILAELDADA
ncbi:MAG: hypothetical protein IT385_15865 [Deltaproteobacteria bacterium]|nr:hypothetical protein [Deltaproteobacteria bacterium]